MVKMFYQEGSAAAVAHGWNNKFNTAAPHHSVVLSNVRKFEDTGSVKMMHKAHERTVLHAENLQQVAVFAEDTRGNAASLRRSAPALGLSRMSYWRALHELGLKCYRPQLVVELSEDDNDRRMEHCELWTQKFNEDVELKNRILWSDESQFCMNGHVNKHNCCYWDDRNPKVQIAVPNDRRGVNVWCGISSAGILGPYFFDGTMTGAKYVTLLQDFAGPHVMQHGLFLQQDGAPAHYALAVRDWLNANLPNRWIGRRGPFEWPARSPDLTVCDFFLWGYIKHQVYSQGKPATLDELRDAIQEACDAVPLDMCSRACNAVVSRYEDCIAAEGKALPY